MAGPEFIPLPPPQELARPKTELALGDMIRTMVNVNPQDFWMSGIHRLSEGELFSYRATPQEIAEGDAIKIGRYNSFTIGDNASLEVFWFDDDPSDAPEDPEEPGPLPRLDYATITRSPALPPKGILKFAVLPQDTTGFSGTLNFDDDMPYGKIVANCAIDIGDNQPFDAVAGMAPFAQQIGLERMLGKGLDRLMAVRGLSAAARELSRLPTSLTYYRGPLADREARSCTNRLKKIVQQTVDQSQ